MQHLGLQQQPLARQQVDCCGRISTKKEVLINHRRTSAVATAFKSAQQEISGGGGGNSISESGSAGSDSKALVVLERKMGECSKSHRGCCIQTRWSSRFPLANSLERKWHRLWTKATNETVGGSIQQIKTRRQKRSSQRQQRHFQGRRSSSVRITEKCRQ